MIDAVRADLRLALRNLRRRPLFTVVAVSVIALGSGAVTTVYSAMNAVLLRPLPGVEDPAGLDLLQRRSPAVDDNVSASYLYFDALRRSTETLQDVAAFSKASLSIAVDGPGIAAAGNIVSGNYFAVLGVHPLLGRFFSEDEDRAPLAAPVIVVSEEFWRDRLGADPSLVGRELGVNGRRYTLIGVAPSSFMGVFTPLRVDAWVPLMMQPHVRPGRDLDDPSANWLWLFGRRRPGVTEAAVSDELSALTAAFHDRSAEPASLATYDRVDVSALTGLPPDASRAALGFMALFLGAAALVLLIASVNVAAMQSARAVARRQEMAVRVALGAKRGRLVRQLLTETAALFTLGAGGGFLLCVLATAALERLPLPLDAPLRLDLSPDWRVFAFALLLSLAMGLVSGLVPAWRSSRPDLATRLGVGTGRVAARHRLVSGGLVVGQLAFSLVLLVAAGLFLKAFDRGRAIDPGFDSEHVVTADLDPVSWGYDARQAEAFYRVLDARLREMPEISTVAYTTVLPLQMGSSGGRIHPDGAAGGPADDRDGMRVEISTVSAGYFDALRIPILAGRAIDEHDVEGSQAVAVVNQTLARRLWPGGDAVGRTFRSDGERVRIVGVARDAKYADLSETTPPFVYYALGQGSAGSRHLLVRSAASAALPERIRRAVSEIDPALPPPVVTTMRRATAVVLLPQRAAALTTAGMGTVGLLLAAVGLYGVIAYAASRRTREVGVRVALGARPRDVVSLVLGEGLRLAAIGVVLGLILAAAATRLMQGLLLDVSPLDLPIFGGMSLIFALVAALASWIPARRAANVDPMAALRVD